MRSLCALVLAAAAACGGSRPGDGEICRAKMGSNAFADAVEPCERAFRGGDAASGASAARAHLQLGHADRVLELAGALAATARAGDGAYYAGRVHDGRREVAQARALYERAYALHGAARDSLGAAKDAYMLYRSHWVETRYGEALRWAEATRVGAEAARDESLHALALQALATAYWEIGQVGLAETATRAAIARLPVGDLRRAALHVHEGLIHLAEERRALARRSFETAVTLAAVREPNTARAARLDLAEMALDDGDLPAAGTLLDEVGGTLSARDGHARVAYLFYRARWHRSRGEAESAAQRLDEAEAAAPADDWKWELALARGQVLEDRGDRAGAEAAYGRAVAALEAMRSELGPFDLKAWFLPKRRRPYESLVALHAAAGRVKEALAAAERMQARAFLDAFTAARAEAPASLERGAEQAAGRVAALARLDGPLAASPAAAPAPVAALLADLRGLHAWFYVRVGARFELFVVAGGAPRRIALSAPAARILSLVDAVRARPDDEAVLRELGDALVPAEALPAASSPIHVVVDRALEPVPFAALAPRGRRLLEDHAIAFAPSLTVLAALARSAREPAGAVAGAVVIADARGDLPGAAREAIWVGARLGAPARLGASATEAALRGGAAADVLHLATHTGVDATGAWIALAGGPVPSSRILEWGVRPRLAVLASCASAASAAHAAWGSLGAAFLAAGSRHVVAALRSVDDAAAERLVRAFYEHGGARSPVAALARAQRQLSISSPPSAWAPFVVIGGP